MNRNNRRYNNTDEKTKHIKIKDKEQTAEENKKQYKDTNKKLKKNIRQKITISLSVETTKPSYSIVKKKKTSIPTPNNGGLKRRVGAGNDQYSKAMEL